MRFSILLLIFTVYGCAAGMSASSSIGDMQRFQVHENNVLERFAFTPSVLRELSRTPALLQPSDNDYYTISADLNGDSLPDIVAILDHYFFYSAGKAPMYVFIKNKHDYTQLEPVIYVKPADFHVLNTISNGFKDISAGGNIYRYNGNNYE